MRVTRWVGGSPRTAAAASLAAAVLVLVPPGALGTAGASQRPSPVEPRADRPFLAAVGDSLTYGFGVPAGKDYPTQLAKLSGRRITNLGETGACIVTDGCLEWQPWVETFKPMALDPRPQVVVVQLGINDISRGTPARDIIAGYRELAREAGAAHVPIVFGTLWHVGRALAAEAATYNPEIDAVNDWLLHNRGLTIADYSTVMNGSDGYMRAAYDHDGYHPNARGYREMAHIVWRTVRDLLELVPRPSATLRTPPTARG